MTELLDLVRQELEQGKEMPAELQSDLEILAESLEGYVGTGDVITQAAPEPQPELQNGGDRQPDPERKDPSERGEAGNAGAISVVRDQIGILSVRSKQPAYDAYARTLQDLINLFQGRPVQGLSTALVELAARVEILQSQRDLLLEKLGEMENGNNSE